MMSLLNQGTLPPLIGMLAMSWVVGVSSPAPAGEFNRTLAISDAAPDWSDLPGVDGKTHSRSEYQAAKVLVLVFTSNTCPYAIDARERLNVLSRETAEQGVQFVAINANAGPRDDLKTMGEVSRESEMAFPYLKDATGEVSQAHGALRTPEFVVLDAMRKVVYLGSLDDDPEGKQVTKHYVADAIRAALAGEAPPVAETPPVGCLIKYPRQKRRPSTK